MIDNRYLLRIIEYVITTKYLKREKTEVEKIILKMSHFTKFTKLVFSPVKLTLTIFCSQGIPMKSALSLHLMHSDLHSCHCRCSSLRDCDAVEYTIGAFLSSSSMLPNT